MCKLFCLWDIDKWLEVAVDDLEWWQVYRNNSSLKLEVFAAREKILRVAEVKHLNYTYFQAIVELISEFKNIFTSGDQQVICYKEVFLLDSVLIFLLLISRREITTRRRSGCSSECCCFRTKLWSRVKIIITTDNENRNTSVNLSWVMFVRDKQAHSRSGVHHTGIIKSSRHRHWQTLVSWKTLVAKLYLLCSDSKCRCCTVKLE